MNTVENENFAFWPHNSTTSLCEGILQGKYNLTKEINIECLAISPLDSNVAFTPTDSTGNTTVTFEIAHEVRAGLCHSVQFVAVNILDAPKTHQDVATVFDKLYDPSLIMVMTTWRQRGSLPVSMASDFHFETFDYRSED
ncbi:predicted protein [Coccidioides posadasii str. Silveira]|uniref:Predicted protein n=1 Tax=Coccidioides posadasii (strain RMSCC 757 / Silveira) TaxID=443226 RepID=E9DC84_COCPS|nr:predicted protein [Coccidioides posadasii str. Silveira]